MSRLKKSVVFFLVLLVTVSLCACGIGGGGGNPSSKKVVFLSHDNIEGNNITGQLFRSVKSKAEAEGYEIEAFNADGNANLQVDQFNDALGKSPLAIILLAADGDAVVPSIKKANEMGIPVIATNRDVNGGVFTNVINDEKQGGRLQGEYMAKHLPQGATVVYLTGDMAISGAGDRWEGFKEACLDKRPDIQLLAKTATGDWSEADGIKNMTLWMKMFPKIDAVVAGNDNMVYGGYLALKANGRADGVLFSGVDATDNVLKQIEAGTMSQTIMQDLDNVGAAIVEQLKIASSGQKLQEGNVLVPLVGITKDNIAKAKH